MPAYDIICDNRLEMPKDNFKKKVFSVVRKIPPGSILTYKEVARRAGNVKAARAVGAVLRTNFDPEIPCHRVIRSDGTFGGYNRGIKKKVKILKEELKEKNEKTELH